MFRKKEDRTIEILVKVFLVVGILAGLAVLANYLYKKYKEKLEILDDEGFDCDFECFDIDGHDGDCDHCEFNHSCASDDKTEETAEEEPAEETAEEAAE